MFSHPPVIATANTGASSPDDGDMLRTTPKNSTTRINAIMQQVTASPSTQRKSSISLSPSTSTQSIQSVSSTEPQSATSASEWVSYSEMDREDMLVQRGPFERGIIVLKPDSIGGRDSVEPELDPEESKNSNSNVSTNAQEEELLSFPNIIIKGRELQFSDALKNGKALKVKSAHTHDLYFELNQFTRSEEKTDADQTLYFTDVLPPSSHPGNYFIVEQKEDKRELYARDSSGNLVRVGASPDDLKKWLKGTLPHLPNKSMLSQGVRLTEKALHSLKKLVSQHTVKFISNLHRRDEIFFPLPDVGLYINPWQSSGAKVKEDLDKQFTGFDHYVTAGCLPGSSLVGLDQSGDRKHLIKHDISFYSGQVITRIEVNTKTPNPYNEMLMQDFEKLTSFIRSSASASKTSAAPLLSYHLPYYDYMLFGVELFVREKMEFNALKYFLKVINFQKDAQMERVKDICHRKGIDVRIASPFDNLFNASSLDATNDTAYAIQFLRELGIEVRDKRIVTPLTESELVKRCLKKLQTNNYVDEQRMVWSDFSMGSSASGEEITLEGLFKIANAVVIGVAAKGKANNKTCSILELSEKQIQLSYNKIRDSIAKEKKEYPAIYNVTYLPSVVPATESVDGNRGLIFYSRTHHAEISKLIKLLSKPALENFYTYNQGRQSGKDTHSTKLHALEKILSLNNSPLIIGSVFPPLNNHFAERQMPPQSREKGFTIY